MSLIVDCLQAQALALLLQLSQLFYGLAIGFFNNIIILTLGFIFACGD